MNRPSNSYRPKQLWLLILLAPLLMAADPPPGPQQLAGPADLLAQLSLIQNLALPEATHSVQVAIENVGSTFQGSFTNSVRLSTDSVCDASDDLLLSLESDGLVAGARIEFTRNVATPAASSLTEVQLCWQVDAQGELIESDENNNLDQATLLLVPGLAMSDSFESGDDSYWDPLEP